MKALAGVGVTADIDQVAQEFGGANVTLPTQLGDKGDCDESQRRTFFFREGFPCDQGVHFIDKRTRLVDRGVSIIAVELLFGGLQFCQQRSSLAGVPRLRNQPLQADH